MLTSTPMPTNFNCNSPFFLLKGGLKMVEHLVLTGLCFPKKCCFSWNPSTNDSVNMRSWLQVVFMLVYRLQHWPNIKTTGVWLRNLALGPPPPPRKYTSDVEPMLVTPSLIPSWSPPTCRDCRSRSVRKAYDLVWSTSDSSFRMAL